jgi:hypothetical protein
MVPTRVSTPNAQPGDLVHRPPLRGGGVSPLRTADSENATEHARDVRVNYWTDTRQANRVLGAKRHLAVMLIHQDSRKFSKCVRAESKSQRVHDLRKIARLSAGKHRRVRVSLNESLEDRDHLSRPGALKHHLRD